MDKTFLRRGSRLLAVDLGGEAMNVNSLDEAPDSSWFENRIGLGGWTPERVAAGPCSADDLPVASEPWMIVNGKPGGNTPGFQLSSRGRRYMVKFDNAVQQERGTFAEVVASRIYHAAGFRVPCNTIIHFRRSDLRIAPGAQARNARGDKEPLTWAHVDQALGTAGTAADGRYRAVASALLEGKPLGAWRYHGTHDGDRNDVVDHENRRELRGSRLLAAWTEHADVREGNTLAMWRTDGGEPGFVLHHHLDFNSCFGGLWPGPVTLARLRGQAYWFEPMSIGLNFLTLGLVEQAGDQRELGPLGVTLGYYDADSFDPENWKPRYPNPTFERMTERDGAWMARIIARFDAESLARSFREGQPSPRLERALLPIVLARRERILRRYFSRLSPLSEPRIEGSLQRAVVCATDLAVRSGVAPRDRSYVARVYSDGDMEAGIDVPVQALRPGEPCVTLPKGRFSLAGRRPDGPALVVQIAIVSGGPTPAPIQFHLHQQAGHGPFVAGIRRL